MRKKDACLAFAIVVHAFVMAAALSALLVSILVSGPLKQRHDIERDIIIFGVSTIVLFFIILFCLCFSYQKSRARN